MGTSAWRWISPASYSGAPPTVPKGRYTYTKRETKRGRSNNQRGFVRVRVPLRCVRVPLRCVRVPLRCVLLRGAVAPFLFLTKIGAIFIVFVS
jgi:hypothetical protein